MSCDDVIFKFVVFFLSKSPPNNPTAKILAQSDLQEPNPTESFVKMNIFCHYNIQFCGWESVHEY